jgi:hypothetical protein
METNIYKTAFYNIVHKSEEILFDYMSLRPKEMESADWTKEDIRHFLLDLLEYVELQDYSVEETIDGQENQ